MKDTSVIEGIRGNVCNELYTVFNKGYNQGYNDGIEAGKKIIADKDEDTYEKGLAAAWEAAKTINSLFDTDIENIFGDVDGWTNYSPAEAMDMIVKYQENHFNCGDEIVVRGVDDSFIVTKVCYDHLECMNHEGGVCEWIRFEDAQKTGRRYRLGIQEI